MENSDPSNKFQDLPKAVQKPAKKVSSIWLLPVVAAIMGIFLLYQGIIEKPIEAVINFKTAEGIAVGKTEIKYKGMTIGKVKKIQMNSDLESMDIHVEVDILAEPLLREESQLWLVKPRLSAMEVTGLDTIMSGAYIKLRPGKGQFITRFKALDEPPAIDEQAPGLHLTLISDILPSVKVGSIIYYKNLEVGDVQSYSLNREKVQFEINIYILPEYEGLVTRESRFWDTSGIQFEGSISNFTLKTKSITAMLMGGVAFYTPEAKTQSASAKKPEPVKNNETFTLYEDHQKSLAGIKIIIQFPTSEGITPGKTRVLFKGIEAGYVQRITILPDLSGVNAHVLMDPRIKSRMGKKSKFWMVKPEVGLSGVSGIETLLSGTYIGMEPQKAALHRKFVALEGPPQRPEDKGRLSLTLNVDRRGSLKAGSPVTYRQVIVGEVTGYELSKTAEKVNVFISIQKKYAPLVRENSRFWITSGIEFGLFSGLKTESVESVLAGGVAFVTPGNDEMGGRVRNGTDFHLYEKPMAVWKTWKPRIDLDIDG